MAIQPLASVTCTVYICDDKDVAVAPVPPVGLHEYEYAPVPPEAETEACPFAAPQLELMLPVASTMAVGWFTVTVVVVVQLLISFTVAV